MSEYILLFCILKLLLTENVFSQFSDSSRNRNPFDQFKLEKSKKWLRGIFGCAQRGSTV